MPKCKELQIHTNTNIIQFQPSFSIYLTSNIDISLNIEFCNVTPTKYN
jgi:hypothetical protein